MYGLVHAPELESPGLHWLNVERPPRLVDLRGRLVILDFWTSCCINCMHVLPTLARIEEEFADAVTVIGIHSPKFEAERDPDMVRHAIQRHGIRHAVALDNRFGLWQAYCVKAWPTLAFIAPDGRFLGNLSGEPDSDKLIEGIREMLSDWKNDGIRRAAPLAVSQPARQGRALAFPGKVKPVRLGDGDALAWAAADAGHHQVVLFDDGGKELKRFGTGAPGFDDGDAATAAFNAPQGLAAANGVLAVADTGNHALRAVDLASGRVRTLAGTGKRGVGLCEAEPALQTPLASPWDVEWHAGRVLFANAGSHQLGVCDPDAGTVALLAGSSLEDIADGGPLDAKLAQPSGLAVSPDGTRLAFADSETSAIRLVHLDMPAHEGGNRVETLIGSGLFDFGHVNGPFEESVLQHPLGLSWADDDTLIVADTYNGRLRRLDLKARQSFDVGEASFACDAGCCVSTMTGGEPAGVWSAGPERMLFSDTNNHRILEVNPSARTVRVWAE
jgi:sugar lactone lactonase YvrE